MGGYRRVVNELGHLAAALATRVRVAIAEGGTELAQRHAHAGLRCAAEVQALLAVPDILESLAGVAADAGSQREAARMFGAAEAIRNRTGLVRFKIYDAGYESSVATVKNGMERDEFDRAWGRTGDFIMIHGICSSRGCYAMTDEQIGEIYALARESFFGGQAWSQETRMPVGTASAWTVCGVGNVGTNGTEARFGNPTDFPLRLWASTV